MVSIIHRTSLSAWDALREAGGLDIDDRDDDLIGKLKDRLDATAPDLKSALAGATVEQLLSALFTSIQPFVSMFRDILTFFERAGARQGQSQWRVSVGDGFLDFRHFEEFLEHWNAIDADLEVPALDRHQAFFLNDICTELRRPTTTGLPDVDDWLAEYDAGRYAPFPSSLMPNNFPPGLSDAATVILAAVSILRRRNLTRQKILDEHRARHYKAVDDDALHPWTIAQNETDYWLRSHVGYLAYIQLQPKEDLQKFAAKAVEKFAPFPRRRIPGKIEVKDLERLLSLPVWKQRYETYGVWIATRIVGSLDDHDVVVRSDDGELKFAFSEAKIADITTTNPRLSLFSERRVALVDPVGKSRTESAQPDFSIWTEGGAFSECALVVEVKHYKKRSRRNFRDALIDYSRAHPRATVVLVNYGPVGKEFSDLPGLIGERCKMIGPLTPESYSTLADFRDLVRSVVGSPVRRPQPDGFVAADQIIALDVSGSMKSILASHKLCDFLAQSHSDDTRVAVIDQNVRAIVARREIERWLEENELGSSTSLAAPVAELLSQYEKVIVVTDESGLQTLSALHHIRMANPLSETDDVIFVQVTR